MKSRVQALYHSDECRHSCTLISAGEYKRVQALLRGQGTIEYLVIIAIVVVISLIVVGLMTNMFQSSSVQVNSSTDKVGNLTSSGIVVVESVEDSSGDSLVRLQNNSGEALILEKVVIGGSETSFNEQLVSGDAKSFSLSDLDLSCPCVEGQESVSCTFDFYVTTQTGLSKKQTTTITTQCQAVVEATNPSQVVGLGSGTLADPWIINSCSELQDMNSHLDGNYALGTDINCADTINWEGGKGFNPIGVDAYCLEEFEFGCASSEFYCLGECLGTQWFTAAYFTGSLDGRNHTINGIYINRPTANYIGLFGYSQGNISNTNLTDANVNGYYYVGGLVGFQKNGLVSSSSSSGTITGYGERTGGLIGNQNGGTINNCHATGEVISFGSQFAGGLVGFQYPGLVSNSYFNGTVSSTIAEVIGGLVGYQGESAIVSSYSLGSVTSTNDSTGGLVGANEDGSIYNSYSLSTITGTRFVGGIVGDQQYLGLVSGSYFVGTITSTSYSGGIVGRQFNTGVVTNSFSTSPINSGTYKGGVVGQKVSGSSITTSYWDVALTGKSNCYSDGNTGCTSTDNNVIAYYGSAGVTKLGNDANWVARDGNYPILSWQ